MVEKGATGINHQDIAQLFSKDLVGMADDQDIIGLSCKSISPVTK